MAAVSEVNFVCAASLCHVEVYVFGVTSYSDTVFALAARYVDFRTDGTIAVTDDNCVAAATESYCLGTC